MNCPECNIQNDADSRFCKKCGLEFESQEVERSQSTRPSYSDMLKTRFVLWGAGGLGYVIGILLYGIWGGIALGVLGFGCGFYILSKRKND
ncbi:MAG: hypothetical protein CL735_01515 [Chloroflexi bacterium]|nr:hypothetical protein [Chloroflexota bacterium]